MTNAQKGAKLTWWRLAAISFVLTMCGPFGIETALESGGAVWTMAAFFITPLLYVIPQVLMVSEMAMMMPSNHGYIIWVQRGWGSLLSFFNGYNSVIVNTVDMAVFPVLASNYLLRLLAAMGFLPSDESILYRADFSNPAYRVAIVFRLLMIVCACFVACLGTAGATNIALVLAVLVFTVFMFLFICVIPDVDPADQWLNSTGREDPNAPPNLGAFSAAALWMFTGWNGLGALAGDMGDDDDENEEASSEAADKELKTVVVTPLVPNSPLTINTSFGKVAPGSILVRPTGSNHSFGSGRPARNASFHGSFRLGPSVNRNASFRNASFNRNKAAAQNEIGEALTDAITANAHFGSTSNISKVIQNAVASGHIDPNLLADGAEIDIPTGSFYGGTQRTIDNIISYVVEGGECKVPETLSVSVNAGPPKKKGLDITFIAGLGVGLVVGILMYFFPLVTVLTADEVKLVAWKDGFFVDAMNYAVPGSLQVVISVAIICQFGLLYSSLVCYSRIVWGLSELGWLPHQLQHIHPTLGSPVNATIVQSLALVPLMFFDFSYLQRLEFTLAAIAYTITYTAFLRLRYIEPDTERPFTVPGGIPVAWALAVVMLFVMSIVASTNASDPVLMSMVFGINVCIGIGYYFTNTTVIVDEPAEENSDTAPKEGASREAEGTAASPIVVTSPLSPAVKSALHVTNPLHIEPLRSDKAHVRFAEVPKVAPSAAIKSESPRSKDIDEPLQSGPREK